MLRVGLVRVADHAEQAAVLRHAVDGELRVENLVAAMFAIGLREHHQLHVGRVAPQLGEGRDQVVHLVIRQRQAKLHVSHFERCTMVTQHVHMRHGGGMQLSEQAAGMSAVKHGAFGHAVVQQVGHLIQLRWRQRFGAQQTRGQRQPVLHQTLDPAHSQAAVVGDVGGLGGPGRHRAKTRRDHDHRAIRRPLVRITIG